MRIDGDDSFPELERSDLGPPSTPPDRDVLLNDLRLEFHAVDSLGHMAVRGHLGWNHPQGFPLQLRFGFHFEPDRLPALLRFFETIRH
jgi:hypothetical protein